MSSKIACLFTLNLLIGLDFFLPKKTYLKCSTLYDFCRTIDNIVDDSETLNIKKNKFLNFKSDFVK